MYLEHLFTEEHNAIRNTIRRFVEKEVIPVRNRLEQDYSLVEEIHQKLVDIGVQKLGYPADYGGNGPLSIVTLGIISEELARGDAGISASSGINAGIVLNRAVKAQNKAVMERFIPAFCGNKLNYACLSMTDSTGGADTENPLFQGKGITTRARLEGDEYVINGTKSWPTHAGIASVYLTVCTTDRELGDEGIAMIYVPGDSPGLSFGKPEDKLGFKTCINASIFYDNVRVPKEYRLAGPGLDAQFYYATMSGSQWHSSVISLGIAQAAFEIVLDYTRDRKSGGKPVREWGLAAGIIAEMAIRLEMTRGAVYNLAWMLSQPDDYGEPFSKKMISMASATRVFAADACVWITNKSIELMGSNGLSPEYHLEKLFRDSKTTQIWLGGQQIALYHIAQGYYDYSVNNL